MDQMPRGHGKTQDSSPKQTQGQSDWTLTHPSKRKAEPSAPPRPALPSGGQECDGAAQEGCSPVHKLGRSGSQPWLPRDPSPREARAGWTRVPEPEVSSRSGGSHKVDLTSHVPAPPQVGPAGGRLPLLHLCLAAQSLLPDGSCDRTPPDPRLGQHSCPACLTEGTWAVTRPKASLQKSMSRKGIF